MISTALGLTLSACSFGFGVLVYASNNSRRTSERITRLEAAIENLQDIPTRIAKVESLSDHSYNRLEALETELKTEMRELKTMLMNIAVKLGA
jgi:DNA repair ATPase RecN